MRDGKEGELMGVIPLPRGRLEGLHSERLAFLNDVLQAFLFGLE